MFEKMESDTSSNWIYIFIVLWSIWNLQENLSVQRPQAHQSFPVIYSKSPTEGKKRN